MILGLDHTGLALPDLEAGRALFAKLGFTLAQREILTQPGPDGTQVSSGADNHVIMMRQGYQELISVFDPAPGHMLLPRIARYWGLHIIVIACDDAEAERAAFTARGVDCTPCATWGRYVPSGGEARFRFFMVADNAAPEAALCLVQHLTPDALRPAYLLAHENDARALSSCTLHVANLAEATRRYAAMFDMPVIQGALHFANGTELRLADRAGLAAAYPGADVPAAPAIAGIEFAIGKIARLDKAGLPLLRDGPDRWLLPRDGFGAIVRFSQVA